MNKRSRRDWSMALAISLLIIALLSPLPIFAQESHSAAVHDCEPTGELSSERFQSVMQTVAEGWNRGDARLATSCFAENAIYSGPPATAHRGRIALYEFFGGAKGRNYPMHMTWHNLVFDPVRQIGVGEYTFQYRKQTHGLVIVRISNGLILNWREYEVESNVPWNQFIGDNRFWDLNSHTRQSNVPFCLLSLSL